MRGLSHPIDAPATRAPAVSDSAGQAGPDPAESLTATLREAATRHGARAVLLCSFQKEESVLLDELLRSRGRATRVRIVTIDTGVLFEETLETWRAFEERYGVAIEVQDASAPEGDRWSGPEHCCSQAKVAALERALDGAEGWITGIRREQGPTREQTELIERDEQRGLWKYNPLAHWTEKDLWRRIHERNLPVQPAARPGVRLDRVRAVHPAGQRPRGPVGRHEGRPSAVCT